MTDQVLTCVLQYAGYALEATICLLLFWQGKWRRLKGLCLYIAALFILDGVARSAALSFFGESSTQYYYLYWVTDALLTLGAFLLICGFFRRALVQQEKLWGVWRLALVFVFLLVVGVSALTFSRNYAHLYGKPFIVEFSQNLYFSCLVLNTVLYVMMQQLAIEDEELGFLVCGLGIQFAGEAAGLALYHVTGQAFASHIFGILNPICALGMYLTWVYAIMKTPQAVPIGSRPGKRATLLPAVAD